MNKAPKKPSIKMIVLDLDGISLLHGHLFQGIRDTLEKAMAQGVFVVVATGRCYCSLPEEVLSMKGLRYIITSNGAKTFDKQEERFIYSCCHEPAAVQQVVALLQQRPEAFSLEFFVDGKAYIDEKDLEVIRCGQEISRRRDYVLSTRTGVADIFQFGLDHQDNIENISIIFPDPGERLLVEPLLRQIPGITVTTSFPENWELSNAKTDKGEAVTFLGEYLGIPKEGIMACGDSPNDLTLLQAAGLAVAVGNAQPQVKAVADYIAPANDEDGVAVAVEKWVL